MKMKVVMDEHAETDGGRKEESWEEEMSRAEILLGQRLLHLRSSLIKYVPVKSASKSAGSSPAPRSLTSTKSQIELVRDRKYTDSKVPGKSNWISKFGEEYSTA